MMNRLELRSSFVSNLRRTPTMLICWGIVVFIGGYLACLAPETFILRFGIGDALVYPRVAFHVATGHGSTYNRLVPTNGYHPLWMWLHVPLMLGAQTILERLWLVQKLWVGTAVVAALSCSTLVWQLTGNDGAAGLTALLFGAFGWSLYVLYSGIETPIVLACLSGVYALAIHLRASSEHSVRPAALYGYALTVALTFLARLDSVFLLLPTFWLIAPALTYVKRSAILIAAAILMGVTLPYLAWNVIVMGDLMPVSGIVKTVPHISLSRSLATLTFWMFRIRQLGLSPWLMYGVSIIGIGLLMLSFHSLRRTHPEFSAVVASVGLGAVGHYGYYFIKMNEINIPWHMYPQFTIAYLSIVGLFLWYEGVLSHVITHLYWLKIVRGLGLLALIGLLLSMTFTYHAAKRIRRPEVAVVWEVGQWVQAHLPADARIAMYDSFIPATIASQHIFVDLNGLVEDGVGARLIREGQPEELIQMRQCTYLIKKEIGRRVVRPSERNAYGTIVAVFPSQTAIYPFHYEITRMDVPILMTSDSTLEE